MQKKLDNLKGSLKILGASLETLGIVIGSNFTPYLKAASDVLRELVNWFIKMPKPMQQIIGFALLFGGSFLVVGGALAKISALSIKSYKAFVDLGKGLQIMGGLMSSAIESMQALWAVMLANPIFLIILALVAIGVAFYLLYTRSETFRRGIQRIWGAIKEGAEWLYNWVKQNWPDLIALLFGPIGVAYIIWRHFGDKIKEVAADIWQKVSGFFSNLYDAVTGWTAQAYHDVVDWFARLPGVIGGFLAHLIDIVVQFVEKIPYYFGYALGVAIALIVISYKKILDLFTNLFLDLIQLQISFVKWFIDKTIEWGSKTIVAIINFMAQLPGLIWGFLLQVIAFFVNFVAMMVQKTVELGFSVLSTIFQFFSQLPGIILNFLQQALNFVIFIAGQVIQSIINMGYSVISEAWNFFSQLPGTILNAIGDAYHLLYDWGANVIHGLIDGIKSLIGDVTGVIGSIGGGIKDGFSKAVHLGSPSKDFRQYGQWIVQGLILGMQDMGSALGTATQAIGTTIKAAAGISSDLYPAKGTGPGYSKGYYDYIPGQPPSGSTTNIEINNPVGETAEDSLSKTMQRLAYVGVTE
jgi:phage-related protein